jgi:glycosyltransferase involved in cell wall biosynthesis
MRILMLVPYPNIKGPVPKHTPYLVQALRDLGCDLVTEPWGRHHDGETWLDKITGRISDIIRIRRTASQGHFDGMVVKTAHDWATLSRDIPMLIACRGLTPWVAIQFHGSNLGGLFKGSKLFQLASRWLCRLSDGGLVLSSEERECWQRFYPQGYFYCVRNPYLPPKNRPQTRNRQRFGLPEQGTVLLFAGRLIEAKGILDLLHAMPAILEKHSCYLMIAGDGPQEQEAQMLAVSLGIQDRVIFTGYLSGDALQEAYQAGDVFVFPSWSEGFPTVLAEAMDCGLPIVTTRIQGAADHLQEGIHALFVSPRDFQILASTVCRLLDDQPLQERMRKSNKERIKIFKPAVVGREYLDILNTIDQLTKK